MGSRTASSSGAVLAIVVAALVAGSAARAATFSACLVMDAGAGSAAVDRLAYAGLLAAERAGVRGRVLRPTSPGEYRARLDSCAHDGAGLTIGIGTAMQNAVDAAATADPGRRFAIVGVDVRSLTHRPPNVVGLLFKDQEAGYLVGYAAGLWTKLKGGQAVGSVAAIRTPPVDRYVAGFQFGATTADPGVKTLSDYSDNPYDPSACRRKALQQISHGAAVVFDVADRCGMGTLAAARDHGIFAISVDADRSRLGPSVMTVALEHVDVAVRSAVLSAAAGRLRAGGNDVFGAGRGGVGYGTWSPRVPVAIRTAVARQLALLAAGRIHGIPTTPS